MNKVVKRALCQRKNRFDESKRNKRSDDLGDR